MSQNKTTLRLSFKFKTNDPILSKRETGAKIKKNLQTLHNCTATENTQREKNIKKQITRARALLEAKC